MFGYFESDDLEQACAYLAAQPISTRWQDAMAGLSNERVPDYGILICPVTVRLEV